MRTHRPRVTYWNNIPSPYMVARLNAVARRGSLNVDAWFSARSEPDRSWDVEEGTFEFPWRYLPRPRVGIGPLGHHHVTIPTPLLARSRPDLLVSLYAGPAYLGGWAAARVAGVRVALRYLPTFDTWVRRTRSKEWLKRHVFPHVDGFKTPGPDGRAALEGYGVDPARIHFVTQSVDVEHWIKGADRWRPERTKVRAELELTGTTFIYVGRLWSGKGIDHLLDAYRQLDDVDASLMLVGDGSDEAALRVRVAEFGLQNVIFTGFVQHRDLPRYYAAADALIFPTLGDPNGLVVEEAMASGLPVISSTEAGDIRLRIPEGVAGYIVPPADPTTLADRMRTLASNPDGRRAMGVAASQIAAKKGLERYAEDFERFVDRVLSMPRAS